jgi:hypothetical protein
LRRPHEENTSGKPGCFNPQKLLNYSREHNEDFMLTLTHFAIERFLYRLSHSKHADRFVLKGAMLFAAWTEQPYRPTRDVDFLGSGDESPETLAVVIREICITSVDPDALEFVSSSIRISGIREEQDYRGKRIQLVAKLGQAIIPLQIDIGYGDAITPGPEMIRYPTLLDLPAPEISAYPKETVIAEKLEAMVALGRGNSRMKDYADIEILSREFEFDGERLSTAIHATFERRRTEIPNDVPDKLSEQFAQDPEKRRQWDAFRKRNSLDASLTLPNVVAEIWRFLQPPMSAAFVNVAFKAKWAPLGPWR